MNLSPFQMQSKSFLVDNTAAVQVKTAAGSGIQYRIRSRNSAEAWISWAAPNPDGSAPTMNTTLPIVGTGQSGIIGMNALVTETFSLPPNAWFQASAGATFEVMSGEGA